LISYIKSACIKGISGKIIETETDIVNGLPYFDLVGLSGKVANESVERVRCAVRNSGYIFPMKRILVNLAPAEIHKEGSHYDLSIALGVLAASEQIKMNTADTNKFLFIGELSLDGKINPIKGILPIITEAIKHGFEGVVIPRGNVHETLLINGIRIIVADSLKNIIHFAENPYLYEFDVTEIMKVRAKLEKDEKVCTDDFSDIKGQKYAKRALEIAAAGTHNCLMVGSPGSGKTMLAKRAGGILPEMTENEAVETGMIYSVAGYENKKYFSKERPFRSPHHGITSVKLIGGGRIPAPGEISLAHNGILFLDEICEFDLATLDMLREPLSIKQITISRKEGSVTFPSKFMLVAAANPCKCGMYLEKGNICKCTPKEVTKYQNRLSGAIMDRIDIKIELYSQKYVSEKVSKKEETSQQVRNRVELAWKIQTERFREDGITSNSQMNNALVEKYIQLDSECISILEKYSQMHYLSLRGVFSVLKLTRTIADLDCSAGKRVGKKHLMEALQYRIGERGV